MCCGVSAGCLGSWIPGWEFHFCARGDGESWEGFKQGRIRIRFGFERSPFEFEEGEEGLAELLVGQEGSLEESRGLGVCWV